jgi:hypothetical protein
MPNWYCPDEYVLVERQTRRRLQLRRLLAPHEPLRWVSRDGGGGGGAAPPLLSRARWPPAHQLLASRRHALSARTLAALDSCADALGNHGATATQPSGGGGGGGSWAPHDRLGYQFGAIDWGVSGVGPDATAEVAAAVTRLAAETWGQSFASANRVHLQHDGAAFLLRYTDGCRPPPPHLDVKGLASCGAQTANAIIYLTGGDGRGAGDGGATVLLGALPPYGPGRGGEVRRLSLLWLPRS